MRAFGVLGVLLESYEGVFLNDMGEDVADPPNVAKGRHCQEKRPIVSD